MDRSSSTGIGIKFIFGRFGAFKIEYNNEFNFIEPDIAFPDPELFPNWDDELRKVQTNLTIDSRDNAILPRYGLYLNVLYETSMIMILSHTRMINASTMLSVTQVVIPAKAGI